MATPRKIKKQVLFAQGNEAVVEGALLAGCSFFAGYPITPSSEIMEEMSRRLPRTETGVFLQMEDEIASMGAIIGASLARTPLGRLTTPGDVADVVLLLCSDLAGMIHGQVVTVDGGYAIHG